jgi:hypothetical protein
VRRVKDGCLRPLDYAPVEIGFSAGSDGGSRRQKQPLRMQQCLNNLPDRQGQGSLRPSFSISSLCPRTMRSPRLTLDSEGKPLRRLRMASKAAVLLVVERFHGVLLLKVVPSVRVERTCLAAPASETGAFACFATRGWF